MLKTWELKEKTFKSIRRDFDIPVFYRARAEEMMIKDKKVVNWTTWRANVCHKKASDGEKYWQSVLNNADRNNNFHSIKFCRLHLSQIPNLLIASVRNALRTMDIDLFYFHKDYGRNNKIDIL